jgi:hypothetical protein
MGFGCHSYGQIFNFFWLDLVLGGGQTTSVAHESGSATSDGQNPLFLFFIFVMGGGSTTPDPSSSSFF